MVRVGVIGVGGMGSFHAHTLAGLAGVEVVAVADPHEPNRQRVAETIGCEPVADPLALARRDDLDGVVIASPDDTHPELAIAALGAGAFVLCEKPLAISASAARRVVDAEIELGRRRVQLGFMREFDPAHQQLVAAIGTIGPIDHVRLVHRNANTTRRTLEQIIIQSQVHEAHSLRFITGDEVTSVTAFGGGPENGSFRHVLARAELAGGGHATLEFDDGGFAYEVTVEVLGRSGDALTGAPTRAVTRRLGTVGTDLGNDWFGWFADAYRAQDAAWIESIRSDAATGPSTWDGFAAQLIVEAILTSVRESRTVAVDPLDRPALYR